MQANAKTVLCLDNDANFHVDERLSHIAFIMDGNGRYARERNLPREYGHTVGAKTFEKVIRYCGDIGIETVTVYAFSTENWKRPKHEVDAIMKIFGEYLKSAAKKAEENDLHVCFLGDDSVFPEKVREQMHRLTEDTKNASRTLNVAVNYGARAEITHAVNALYESGKSPITEEDISAHLYSAHSPDPDLIVRTGGELRLSNFLLWQAAYAEFYFSDTLWPEYGEDDIRAAVRAFYERKRRYGGV